MYLGMLERAQETVARSIRVLAETPADASAVYHCAAGKDRTGVLSALLLALFGVDENLIIADYALSQDKHGPGDRPAERPAWLRRGVADAPPETLHAKPETMHELLGELRKRFGGVEAYARTCGIGPDTIELLRERSLE